MRWATEHLSNCMVLTSLAQDAVAANLQSKALSPSIQAASTKFTVLISVLLCVSHSLSLFHCMSHTLLHLAKWEIFRFVVLAHCAFLCISISLLPLSPTHYWTGIILGIRTAIYENVVVVHVSCNIIKAPSSMFFSLSSSLWLSFSVPIYLFSLPHTIALISLLTSALPNAIMLQL